VSLLEMEASTDKEIWTYAKIHDYTIVTLDADFHEYSLLWGGPPAIVWLKCGNQPKNVILRKLIDYRDVIQKAVVNDNIWCVEIY